MTTKSLRELNAFNLVFLLNPLIHFTTFLLYDRSYMRAQEPPPTKHASAVKILLIATIGAFVLQQIINISFPGPGNRPNPFFRNWLELNIQNFEELKVWTIVSYAFLHAPITNAPTIHATNNLIHILGNMLGLFFIGRIIELLIGRQQFFVLYFSGAVIGGITYLFFHLNDASSVIGASAAVSALLAFFCMHYPEQPVTFLLFFIIPMTIKPKWLFWGFLGVSTYLLLFSEIQGTNRVAHSAHLGGFLTGVVYYRYIYSRRSGSKSTFRQPGIELPNWFKRRKKTKSQISYQVNRPTQNRIELQREVDRILDKINKSGFSSLNDTEKEILDKAKKLLTR